MKGFRSVTTKYILIGLIIIGLVASFMSLSFWFTDRIKEDARRRNLAGKGRMLNFEMAWLLNPDSQESLRGQNEEKTEHLNYLEKEMAVFEEILYALRDGSRKYKLGPLSQGDYITRLYRGKALGELDSIIGKWHSKIRPTLIKAVEGSPEAFRQYNTIIYGYVDEIDSFVSHLDQNYEKEFMLYGRLRLVVAALSAFIFISLIFFTRKSLVEPILRLRDAAEEIEKGNLGVRVEIGDRDEIGGLAENFNRMTQTLEMLFDERVKRLAELDVLNKVAETVSRSLSTEEMLDSVIDVILNLEHLRLGNKGAIFLSDAETKRLKLSVSRNLSEEIKKGCASVAYGECLCGLCAVKGEILVSDSLEAKRYERVYPDMKEHGYIILPLTSRDRMLGVICLYLLPEMMLSDREIDLYKSIADIISVAVQNTLNYKEIEALASFPEKSPYPVIECDMDLNITYINRAAQEIINVWELQETDLLPANISDELRNLNTEKRRSTYQEIKIGSMVLGEYIHFISEKGILRIYAYNITEMKRTEGMMRNIAEGVSAETGEEFFNLLVQYLAKTLEMDYAFVGELTGETDKSIRTIAVSGDNRIVDNFEYHLDYTPCENVVGKGICSYPHGLRQEFPHNRLFAEMGIESYIGAPLFDSAGQPLGVLVVLDRKPLSNEGLAKSLLKVFAVRASAEMGRRQSESALQDSNERYKHLIRSVTDYIYTVYIENGHPVATSHGPGCVAVTGYTSEEYEADPDLWLRMVYEEDTDIVTEQASRAPRGESVLPIEHRIIHKGGSIYWVRNTPVPRYDRDGRLVAIDGLISDITERKQAEEALKRYSKELYEQYKLVSQSKTEMKKLEVEKEQLRTGLIQAQKMEAIGSLAAGIAHDFNNMLTGISGFAEITLSKAGSPVVENYMERVLQITEQASALTEQILIIGRKAPVKKRPIDLTQFIAASLSTIRRMVEEDIIIETDYGKDIPPVEADEGQLYQVLLNLVVNARDAMTGGGKITISTDRGEQSCAGSPSSISHMKEAPEVRADNGYVFISVSDTGTGIDEHIRDRIFDPFFTTKEHSRGTGLGLAVIYSIVHGHQGCIDVISEPGEGAEFRIFFPAMTFVTACTEVENAPAVDMIKTEGKTILVVDDDEIVRDIIEESLPEYGFIVTATNSGEKALEIFSRDPESIDLVMLDRVMPGMSGMELFRRINKVKPGQKVILLTGYALPSDIEEIKKAGILTIIKKPFRIDELFRAVKEVLGTGTVKVLAKPADKIDMR